ncbi:ECF RNA polymerase sigma factor SigK [Gordonia neofelifaecis]|uniref:RNA polymerase sigma factor SigK n=1 Tax=Gordonia neofelifaecis NRRL B-59395 TaxID=644548 RepID=F1YM12_9ACTN|nr:RNA polymerase sigma factor SigK [Gordonia neofelifaecis NRRL B-59395]
MTAEAEQLERLLALVATGDRDAFATFYDRTGSRVYGMVLRVLRDPGYSEDVTQEVFLQVWRDAGRFDARQGSPVSWVLTIAHRRAVDRVRSETSTSARESRYGMRELAEVVAGVDDEVVARDAGDRARECLGTLTELQSEAVCLAYYEGFTYREVADRLAVALPTVKSRIRDGLKRLRGCLGSE